MEIPRPVAVRVPQQPGQGEQSEEEREAAAAATAEAGGLGRIHTGLRRRNGREIFSS